jgi:mercuric ion transport protein
MRRRIKLKGTTLFRAGLTGTAVTGLCCFTPALVILLGTLGLSAWAGMLDYVLFPALAGFIALIFYGHHLKKLQRSCSCPFAPSDYVSPIRVLHYGQASEDTDPPTRQA